MPDNDPLTSVAAMIAAIEPGFRMIDGSLVRELLILAGEPEAAAAIEPGPRLIDTTILKRLAETIPNPVLAQDFVNQMPGKRLIDGIPFKELAIEASVEEEELPPPPPEPDPEPEPEPEPDPPQRQSRQRRASA